MTSSLPQLYRIVPSPSADDTSSTWLPKLYRVIPSSGPPATSPSQPTADSFKARGFVGVRGWVGSRVCDALNAAADRPRSMARKTMVQIFALPGVAPDLVRRYRRALASAINR